MGWINPSRALRLLNKSRLHINDAGISVIVRNFKAFPTNLDWREYEDSVSDNSPFVIGDSVSSSDINKMKKPRLGNASNTIIGHLNISSLRNKFVFVKDKLKLFDVFLFSESNIDHTFPSSQFRINGYKNSRLNRNRFGGGLVLYLNENIQCKPLQDTYIFQVLKLLQVNFTKIIKSGFC